MAQLLCYQALPQTVRFGGGMRGQGEAASRQDTPGRLLPLQPASDTPAACQQ